MNITRHLSKLLSFSDLVGASKKLFSRTSYSQEGEDLILMRYLEKISDGFYVDIGAHHPIRYSNTHLFYEQGWRGINIEPRLEAQKAFKKYRPGDINLQIGISETSDDLTYYMFGDPALNTFSSEVADHRQQKTELLEKRTISTRPLSAVLADHLPSGQDIDFMSIDVEGFDLEVLRSNNWDLYKPSIVLVELSKSNLEDLSHNKIYRFLKDVGYSCVAKSHNTFFFKLD